MLLIYIRVVVVVVGNEALRVFTAHQHIYVYLYIFIYMLVLHFMHNIAYNAASSLRVCVCETLRAHTREG